MTNFARRILEVSNKHLIKIIEAGRRGMNTTFMDQLGGAGDITTKDGEDWIELSAHFKSGCKFTLYITSFGLLVLLPKYMIGTRLPFLAKFMYLFHY